MKKLNKKGFTLIELLAVIVILAVVLGIAIPAVSQYITKSRKNGYVDNLLQFIDAARKGATLGDEYSLPIDSGDATIVKFSTLSKALEKGGSNSSYGNEWKTEGSYVIIVNAGSADSPRYNYYVTASDGKYVTGSKGALEIIAENSLKAADIIRLDSEGQAAPTNGLKFKETENGRLVPASATDTEVITVKEIAE